VTKIAKNLSREALLPAKGEGFRSGAGRAKKIHAKKQGKEGGDHHAKTHVVAGGKGKRTLQELGLAGMERRRTRDAKTEREVWTIKRGFAIRGLEFTQNPESVRSRYMRKAILQYLRVELRRRTGRDEHVSHIRKNYGKKT